MRKFGEIAIDLGYVQPKHLEDALAFQRQLREQGRHAGPIGAILVDLGYMTGREVLRVLEAAEAERTRVQGSGVCRVEVEVDADAASDVETRKLDGSGDA